LGNEGCNVYVRSPDGNQVVAMEHGQFVRVNFDNADEMEITVPKGMIDGIYCPVLHIVTIILIDRIHGSGTSVS